MFVINFFRQNIYFFSSTLLGILFSNMFLPLLENNNNCLINFNNFIKNNNYELNNKIKISEEQDEYQPQINLLGKPLKAQKVPQQIIRPRYFSTELGIKQKLLVSVLSNSIDTNSIAINKTIAHLTEKIIYFVDTSNKINASKLNMPDIVAFIDSRHMLKPFHIFKYLIDNYILEFDYFFFINDSSFVNFRKLNEIINKISIRETLYFGEKINKNSLYCNLNSGIILSNNVLASLKNNIDWCIKNSESDSNDVNIGKCILHSINVQCVNTIMGQTYVSLNINQYTNIKYELQYLKKQNSFNNAITIYPVVKDNYFYILHNYFTKKSLENNFNQILKLRKSIEKINQKYLNNKNNISWPIGNQPGNKPNNRFDILYWKYFTMDKLYLKSELISVSNHTTIEKKDIEIVIQNAIAYVENKYEHYKFKQLINGYKKFDLSRGMDYILDLEFVNNNQSVHKRIQICKPLGKIDILKIPYVTENSRINIILPVRAHDMNSTMKYLTQYKKICMDKKEKTFLMLILIYEPHLPGKDSQNDIFKLIKNKSIKLTKDYKKDNNKISWLSIKLPNNFQNYTFIHDYLLNFAILDLALKKFSPESLIFFTNSYTEFYNDFLNRIRMNTILNYQIFNPIPFTEYNPNITLRTTNTIDINKNSGHFNIHNNNHISFYVKDYTKARKIISYIIPKINNDKNIINLTFNISMIYLDFILNNISTMFQFNNEVHILKSTEPSLRGYYKPLSCNYNKMAASRGTTATNLADNNLNKILYEKCKFIRNFNLGSRSQLSKNVLQYMSKIV